MKPTIILLGAQGQLGRDIQRLQKNNTDETFELICPNRHQVDFLSSEKISLQLSKLKKELQLANIDFVINCAAFTNTNKAQEEKEDSYAINSMALLGIADFVRQEKAILIHISSDYIFDGNKKTPYTEEDLPNPLGHYGLSKFFAEKIIQLSSINHYIFRSSSLFGIYGARGKGGNFVETILKKAKNNEKLTIVNDQTMSPTHTLDMAKTISKLIKGNLLMPFGTYNLTNRGECSWFEFTHEILTQSGLSTQKLFPVSYRDFPASFERPPYSVLSGDKISPYTQLPHWKDALAEYLKDRQLIQSNQEIGANI